jgi:hypothetical protein
MTDEQILARAKRQERYERLPAACLDLRGDVFLSFTAGDERITVGSADQLGSYDICCDLESLSVFIKALCARYNERARNINVISATIKPLEVVLDIHIQPSSEGAA